MIPLPEKTFVYMMLENGLVFPAQVTGHTEISNFRFGTTKTFYGLADDKNVRYFASPERLFLFEVEAALASAMIRCARDE